MPVIYKVLHLQVFADGLLLKVQRFPDLVRRQADAAASAWTCSNILSCQARWGLGVAGLLRGGLRGLPPDLP
jgi:hypothetical protein